MHKFFCPIIVGLMAVAAIGSELRAQTNAPGTFQVKLPGIERFKLVPATNFNGLKAMSVANEWVQATSEQNPNETVKLGKRLVLQLADPAQIKGFAGKYGMRVDRDIGGGVYILETESAQRCLQIASELASQPGVIASYPVIKRPQAVKTRYGAAPNDALFPKQWPLENRGPDGAKLGPDMNVRAAWGITRGENTVIAIADSGLEEDHPDLAGRVRSDLHQNFFTGTDSATPTGTTATYWHGTAVAGLAAATADNDIGIAGVAPSAGIAGWVVLEDDDGLSDERYMDMYQYKSNIVTVQNHSWGKVGETLRSMSVLERIGISNATTHGRGGKGVVMLRAAGNDRGVGINANEQEVGNDPRVISVGAVRQDGKVTSYSQRGANILVAAPSGEMLEGFSNIPSTDRQGNLGYNQSGDSADYALDANGFSGTSASTPQVAGVAALILSANPALTYRDVQRILVLSSRPSDPTDHDLTINGAGLQVSHNTGFGVPDAGFAVQLAKTWPFTKPTREDRFNKSVQQAIKTKNLVEFSGSTLGLDQTVLAPPALSSLGPTPVQPIGPLPLVDVGQAVSPITRDVRGKIAFIQRGENFFYEKIAFAAQAGAAGVIVYDNDNYDQTMFMGLTDFTTIPALFIPQYAGEAIAAKLRAGAAINAKLNFNSDADATVVEWDVPNGLSLEHVGVALSTSHTRRGDLRVVLQSPSGTRSVLQEKNIDETVGPMSWTYWSTHHYLEASGGKWKLFVTDQQHNRSGSIYFAELIVRGVPIPDTDSDGLDDNWERSHFGGLLNKATDDPNRDGINNARHQAIGTSPIITPTINVDLSPWKNGTARLSWPSGLGQNYQVMQANNPAGPYQMITSLPGKLLETEFFLPTSSKTVFFKINKR